MIKEEIRIRNVIMHILDGAAGLPVLSDTQMEFNSELSDFLKEHISRIMSGDDIKKCSFYKDQSEVYKMLVQYDDEFFTEISRDMASHLYAIMNSNIDIPPADLLVVRFDHRDKEYLAILKMNYKSLYTHAISKGEDGESLNSMIRHKTILPAENQRLSEAAVISLDDLSVYAIEKKYEVNGEKTNYFTYLFLKCSSHISEKQKLSIVSRAVESIQNNHYDESKQFEENLRAKNIIHEELEENGGFSVESIADKIFADEPVLKEAFAERMEKNDLVHAQVSPQSEKTVKKYETQVLKTDSGIEIKIPMKEYNDPGSVEFITEQDGTVSVLIKNIDRIRAKI